MKIKMKKFFTIVFVFLGIVIIGPALIGHIPIPFAGPTTFFIGILILAVMFLMDFMDKSAKNTDIYHTDTAKNSTTPHNPPAPTGDYTKGIIAYSEKDYKTASIEFSCLAEQGLAEAQTFIGEMYYNGYDYPQNYEMALKWYKRAANQGCAKAQFSVGIMYYYGQGILQDYNKSMQWFILSAKQEYALAQSFLAGMYVVGHGAQEDFVLAYMWAEIAISNDNAEAKSFRDLFVKEMTPEQIAQAKKLAQEWIANKKPEPTVFLDEVHVPVGDLEKGLEAYEKGDYATTLRECSPLAEQGQANAQYTLGWMYRKGQGVPQDDEQAVKWYRLSAEQGHAKAQSNLGVMYQDGLGVLQDYLRAHMWYNIAATSGNEPAQKNRDIIAEKMTTEQISRAQDLAWECIAKGYKEC